ncbi:hypothetical protein SKAU_G00273510 [Synaphobranchus kaupii]|uniref:Lysosome-associated membrane glycoprotein 2 n=1 Tax=Synaphobranchus kaupii TaxID=118154 RepID=A0A9Q1F0R2_SYNKA|nr:hypothetical protein SKAU_G00273510 [Synaphobranchus kaupii]
MSSSILLISGVSSISARLTLTPRADCFRKRGDARNRSTRTDHHSCERPTTAAANVTTAPPPTTAAPSPMPPPPVGNYNVSDVNGTCLMATMGLQIGYKEDEILKNVNLDPDTTEATGKCGSSGSDATLVLAFNKSSIIFTFSEEGGKFRLHAVNATLSLGTNGTIFRAGNANLSLWEASVGNSYMCRRVQAYNITDAFVLRTNGLRVQPYDVQSNRYSTAHECAMDDTSILIPIVVGAALAGLILIVMIAYVIGRRKTYVGYQTL